MHGAVRIKTQIVDLYISGIVELFPAMPSSTFISQRYSKYNKSVRFRQVLTRNSIKTPKIELTDDLTLSELDT